MQTFRNKTVQILPEFYILLAASLLLLPLQWVVAWFTASAIHELCHYFTLCACGVNVYSVKISISGVIMETDAIRPHHEALSALAGPLGGLLLLIFVRYIPQIAICALVQSVFNLLPIYPLDGGRVFRCCVGHWFDDQKTDVICRFIECLIFSVMFCLSCYLTFYCRLGLLPLAAYFLVFLKCRKIKTPCKQTKQIVQ